MADFVNTRDTMPGSTDEERARQAFDKLIAHELTEFKEDAVDWVRQYAFKHNETLVNVELPALIYKEGKNMNMFEDCSALKTVKLKSLTQAVNMFSNCTNLETIELSDNLNTISSRFLNQENSFVRIFDTKNTSNKTFTIERYAFYYDSLKHLILRSAKVASLSHIEAFYQDAIRRGEGIIYVPASLLASYKTATNWSYFADNIFPIEEVNGEIILRANTDTIQDTWEQILAAEADGSYSTKYHIGDTKSVSIDGVNVKMQIAAFDADTIAGGTEKAKISWVCKKLYGENQKMNTTSSTSGGWPTMPMYTYLNDTSSGVYSKIESTVKDAIKTVVKPYWDAAASAEKTSNDKLWLLSNQEVNFVTSGSYYHKEDGGVTYSGLFPTASNNGNTNRVKYNSSGSANNWWLRSSSSSGSFVSVITSGGANNGSANDSRGVVFGFCT